MFRLPNTLNAWGTDDFTEICRREIESLTASQLPLEQALAQGNYICHDYINAMIIKCASSPAVIQVKAGIFFNSLLTGCSCADDPAPDSEYNEYCELLFDISRENAETVVMLAASD